MNNWKDILKQSGFEQLVVEWFKKNWDGALEQEVHSDVKREDWFQWVDEHKKFIVEKVKSAEKLHEDFKFRPFTEEGFDWETVTNIDSNLEVKEAVEEAFRDVSNIFVGQYSVGGGIPNEGTDPILYHSDR
jgi:hypothetical protein